jgi:hypothetical protein
MVSFRAPRLIRGPVEGSISRVVGALQRAAPIGLVAAVPRRGGRSRHPHRNTTRVDSARVAASEMAPGAPFGSFTAAPPCLAGVSGVIGICRRLASHRMRTGPPSPQLVNYRIRCFQLPPDGATTIATAYPCGR